MQNTKKENKINESTKELIIEKDRMNAVFEDIFIPLIIIDKSLNIKQLNKAAVALLGNHANLNTSIPCISAEVNSFISENQSLHTVLELEVQTRQMLVQISKISDNDILIILQDLSKEHFLAAQLRQAQKMESVGELASGIAHDFSNILTVVGGYINIIKRKLGQSPVQVYLDQLYTSVEKGTSMIKQLLSFSRTSEDSYALTNVNSVVTTTVTMAERLLKDNVEIKLNLYPQDIFIYANAVQIEHCILNLLTNAQDAMPNGGDIIIQTSIVEPSECPAIKPMNAGRCVEIKVSDQGEGMDSITLEHIFNPFFTTKSPQKGTGLGLAMVSDIVKNHKGKIQCDSTPNVGTTFKIYLPLATE